MHRARQGWCPIGFFALAAVLTTACAPVEDVVGVVTPLDEPLHPGCAAGPVLKQRPEGEPVMLVAGMVETESPASWLLLRRGQYVTLNGQGYLNLRWQIEYRAKAGLITPPLFMVASGVFLHVGGGGGKNLGDAQPGTSGTWLGNADDGVSYMPEGVRTPWQNEFYYLDGEVTITQMESEGLYNITVSAQTYADVTSADWGVYEPGVVCDPA